MRAARSPPHLPTGILSSAGERKSGVVVEAGEQLAGLRLIAVAEAEALDLEEQVLAQLEGHTLADALGQVGL